MPIELLWIIPIVAIGIFFFLIAFFAQRKGIDSPDRLTREVARYNAGISRPAGPAVGDNPAERRLGDIEQRIHGMSAALMEQQNVIERFRSENTNYNTLMSDLKKQIRDLQKEYDLVLSENYSLRARVKGLVSKLEDEGKPLPSAKAERKTGVNLKIFDDTRVVDMNNLDDTSEIDISALR